MLLVALLFYFPLANAESVMRSTGERITKSSMVRIPPFSPIQACMISENESNLFNILEMPKSLSIENSNNFILNTYPLEISRKKIYSLFMIQI